MIFMVGSLALVGFIAVAVFISQVFEATFPQTTIVDVTNTNDANTLPYDPLVTVTPKEFLGGAPTVLVDDPVRGSSTPTVTIIEFGDFQCEGCASMVSVLDRVVEEYPNDVRHVWKDFPIPAQHPQSEQAAVAARCAYEQDAFWGYHDLLLSRQGEFSLGQWADWATELELNTEQFTTCLSSTATKEKVVQGYFIARSLDLDATPQYYVNGRFVEGPVSYEELKSIVDGAIVIQE